MFKSSKKTETTDPKRRLIEKFSESLEASEEEQGAIRSGEEQLELDKQNTLRQIAEELRIDAIRTAGILIENEIVPDVEFTFKRSRLTAKNRRALTEKALHGGARFLPKALGGAKLSELSERLTRSRTRPLPVSLGGTAMKKLFESEFTTDYGWVLTRPVNALFLPGLILSVDGDLIEYAASEKDLTTRKLGAQHIREVVENKVIAPPKWLHEDKLEDGTVVGLTFRPDPVSRNVAAIDVCSALTSLLDRKIDDRIAPTTV